MKTFIEQLGFSIKNWWLSLILGILYLGIAIWLMFNPLASYVALSIVFAVLMFVSGLFEIIFSVTNKDALSSWGWYLAGGIIDLLIGLILIASPGLSMAVLPFILAFWLLFRGISGIGFAMDIRRCGSNNWGWYLFLAILAVLCSIGIIWVPAAGALTFVFVTAYAFIVFGIFRLVIAFELRKLHKYNK